MEVHFMKKFKSLYYIAVISSIVIMVTACAKDKNLPENNQTDDSQVEKPIDDDKSVNDDADTEDEKTPLTIDTDENIETNETNDTDDTEDNDETKDPKQNDDNEKPQNEDDILSESDAKEIIEATATKVINAISEKDAATISELVHPVKGLRFTPYTFVSLEDDIVFTQEEMKGFFDNTNEYLWGYYDGTGDEINLTPGEYYSKYIYSEDFKNAPEVGYNKVLSIGNALENQFEVYEAPIVVEYYYPGFNEEYEGMDWRSLRLVFEQYEDGWKLVGIIHNQWTI